MDGWVNATRYVIAWNEAPGHDKLAIQRISCAPANEKPVYSAPRTSLIGSAYAALGGSPQRQFFAFGVGEDARARQEAHAFGPLDGKAGAAAWNHVDDELGMRANIRTGCREYRRGSRRFRRAARHAAPTRSSLCGIAQGRGAFAAAAGLIKSQRTMFGFEADNPEQGIRGGVDSFGRGHRFLLFFGIACVKKMRGAFRRRAIRSFIIEGRPGRSRGGQNSQKKPSALVL